MRCDMSEASDTRLKCSAPKTCGAEPGLWAFGLGIFQLLPGLIWNARKPSAVLVMTNLTHSIGQGVHRAHGGPGVPRVHPATSGRHVWLTRMAKELICYETQLAKGHSVVLVLFLKTQVGLTSMELGQGKHFQDNICGLNVVEPLSGLTAMLENEVTVPQTKRQSWSSFLLELVRQTPCFMNATAGLHL